MSRYNETEHDVADRLSAHTESLAVPWIDGRILIFQLFICYHCDIVTIPVTYLYCSFLKMSWQLHINIYIYTYICAYYICIFVTYIWK